MADTRDSLSAVVSLRDRPTSSSDIDLLLDRHEATIRDLPKGEANKHRRLQTCISINDELGGIFKQHGPLPRALVLHAQLAMQLGKWAEAARVWEKVAKQSPEHRALAHLKAAVAHRSTGNLYAAEIAIASAERAGIHKKDKSYRKEKLALVRAIDSSMAARLVEKSAVEIKRGAVDDAVNLLRAGMFLNGTDSQTAQIGESVFRDFARLTGWQPGSGEAAVPEVQASSTPTAFPSLVLSCGFGYSGSGAVIDYLREFAPVSLPFGMVELGCFEQKHGAESVLRAARDKPDGIKDELVDFFLVRVLGMVKGSSDAKLTQKVRSRSLAYHFRGSETDMEELEAACLGAFASIWQAYGSGNRTQGMHDAFRLLFGRLFRLKANSSQFILLNNAIHGFSINLLSLLPNATAVVVVRDPRDQFLSQAVEAQWTRNINKFIDRSKLHLSQCSMALADPDIKRLVEVVQFEDFVSSADVRGALLHRLGLTEADRNGEQHFLPEQSQQNVGIYRDHPDQKGMKRIYEELAPHLIEPTLCAPKPSSRGM